MATDRARDLPDALLKEPGVAGTLLDLGGGKLGVNLTLELPQALKQGVGSLFDSNVSSSPDTYLA